MAVNTYEGMFLLDSTKVAVSWDESVKHVHDILSKHQSEIVASRQWDERRLAYPVDGHKKGTYLLTYFKADGSHLKDIVADCRLPWERPLPAGRVTPCRVLRAFPALLPALGTLATTPNPCGRSPGRPTGRRSARAPRFPPVKKAS